MRSTPDRRMWRQIAHVFGTRQPGGRSKPAPLRGEIQRLRRKSTEPFEISDLRFEMGERAGSKATARAWLRRRRNLVRGRRPAAKAEFDGGRFSAGLKSSFPLLKSGGCHRDSAAPPRWMRTAGTWRRLRKFRISDLRFEMGGRARATTKAAQRRRTKSDAGTTGFFLEARG